MDATYIVSTCDWILAELVRINSKLSPEECQDILNTIIQKKAPIIFDNRKVQRVLDPKMPIKNQVLILLYHNTSPVSEEVLLNNTEYSNPSVFRAKILKTLHKARAIEYSNGVCELTPLGILEVENILGK